MHRDAERTGFEDEAGVGVVPRPPEASQEPAQDARLLASSMRGRAGVGAARHGVVERWHRLGERPGLHLRGRHPLADKITSARTVIWRQPGWKRIGRKIRQRARMLRLGEERGGRHESAQERRPGGDPPQNGKPRTRCAGVVCERHDAAVIVIHRVADLVGHLQDRAGGAGVERHVGHRVDARAFMALPADPARAGIGERCAIKQVPEHAAVATLDEQLGQKRRRAAGALAKGGRHGTDELATDRLPAVE